MAWLQGRTFSSTDRILGPPNQMMRCVRLCAWCSGKVVQMSHTGKFSKSPDSQACVTLSVA